LSESNDINLTKNLSKAKKDEIRKIVKTMMKSEGINYEDWLSDQEFQFLLSKTSYLNQMLTKETQRGSH